MTIKTIVNNSNDIMYYDSDYDCLLDNIWNHLTLNNIEKSNLDNHIHNSLRYIQSPDFYKPVINKIYPIPPRSIWHYDGNYFKCSQSLEVSNSIYDLHGYITKIIKSIKNYKVGVELSGGFDSSLIIELLLSNGVDPFLIGYSCKRYEFRTERSIQSIYTKKVKESILIDSGDVLPFLDLPNCPLHQLPNPTSIYYKSKYLSAKYCKSNNVDILFNGMSGDNLFCEIASGDKLPQSWYNWMIDNRWFHENIFLKEKVSYLPVHTHQLSSLIFKERHDMGFDSEKIWARQYFKKYLPKELVNYTYKADHVGDYIEGIKRSFFDIKKMFKITKEVTGNKEFSESNFLKLFKNIEIYDDNQLKDIMAKTSFAVWIYSCVNQMEL